METIVLPGFSSHNKEWADDVAKELSGKGINTKVHDWLHWSAGGGLKLAQELKNITYEVGNSQVNIIAKSVGTMVAAKWMEANLQKVNRLILCGIPSTSDVRLEIFKRALENFPEDKVVCFQNTSDPFAKYSDVVNFMKNISPNIKIVKKDRKDHNYPYFEDFFEFLKD